MVQRNPTISLARVAWTRPLSPPAGETTLAFRYLFLFRRVVVSLAIVGAVLAWAYQFPALTAALVCVGIGELLESSYYISVLRWQQKGGRPLPSAPLVPAARRTGSAVT
jgi:hypothetical protein